MTGASRRERSALCRHSYARPSAAIHKRSEGRAEFSRPYHSIHCAAVCWRHSKNLGLPSDAPEGKGNSAAGGANSVGVEPFEGHKAPESKGFKLYILQREGLDGLTYRCAESGRKTIVFKVCDASAGRAHGTKGFVPLDRVPHGPPPMSAKSYIIAGTFTPSAKKRSFAVKQRTGKAIRSPLGRHGSCEICYPLPPPPLRHGSGLQRASNSGGTPSAS